VGERWDFEPSNILRTMGNNVARASIKFDGYFSKFQHVSQLENQKIRHFPHFPINIPSPTNFSHHTCLPNSPQITPQTPSTSIFLAGDGNEKLNLEATKDDSPHMFGVHSRMLKKEKREIEISISRFRGDLIQCLSSPYLMM
jgi:hypothetical protein